MQIETITVTPFEQNSRLIIDTNNSVGAVLDPGGEVSRIINCIEKRRINIKSILLTHSHLDHIGGVVDLIEYLEKKQGQKPDLYGHIIETEMRSHAPDIAKAYGLSPNDYKACPEPDVYIEDGDLVEIGSIKLNVFFTPGHSPGHVVYYSEKGESSEPVLFAGDTLFAGSIGRTDLPGGDYETLRRSIYDKIFTLPDNTLVLPGHGTDTEVGREKHSNPFL
jgi:hydroxyacylglutathione hydrolase